MGSSGAPENRPTRLATAFLKVVGGAASGQFISLLALPLLTRLLSPEDFGYVSRSLAVAMVVAIAMTLRLETAIFSSKLPHRQYAIGVSGIVFSTVLFVAACALVFFVPRAWTDSIGDLRTIDLIAILCVGFSLAVFNTISNLVAADGNYTRLARSKPVKQLTEVLALAGLAAVNAPGWLLLFSTVFGCMVAAVSVANVASLTSTLKRVVSGPIAWAVVRRYRAFIAYDMPASIIVHLRLALPLLFLAQRFDLATVGLFSIAQRLLDALATLAVSSVGMVYRAELRQHPVPKRLFLTVVAGLFVTASLIVGTAVLVPERFFDSILGSEWGQVKLLIGALGIYGIARIVALPIGFTYYVTESVRLNLLLQVSGLATVAIVFLWVPRNWDLVAVVTAYALSQAMFYVVYIAIAYILVFRFDGASESARSSFSTLLGESKPPGSER